MVAIGVFISLSVVLVSICSQMASLWSLNESRSQTREKARSALEFLRRELQQVIFPLDPHQTNGPYLRIEPPGAGAATPGGGLYFTIPRISPAGGGDMAQVGYWVSGNTLYRGLIECPDGKAAPPEDLVAASPGTASSNYQGLFLQGVSGCWIQAYDDAGAASDQWNSRSQNALPARVELTLVVMDEHLTQRLKSGQATLPDAGEFSGVKAYLEELDPETLQHMAKVTINVSFDARH